MHVVVELSSLEIGADRAEEFVKAYPAAEAVLAQAQGMIATQLLQDVEQPGSFTIEVQWSTIEDHTERFVGSELFEQFREIVGSFLQDRPNVRHFRLPLSETPGRRD
jgi:heme-degrading monooxygenase HmoA